MSNNIWVIVGFVVAVGLPLAVIVGAICWPQRIPREQSVSGIHDRIREEDNHSGHHAGTSGSPRTTS
ncbi:hypothetical protein ACIBCN_01585 [Nocardia sp. NPDC051052]|uniref:hypothetical protein n=1 Tax=Nocardia sp. NPDC051052 TaxID=3364322 RepID=UPI0037939503